MICNKCYGRPINQILGSECGCGGEYISSDFFVLVKEHKELKARDKELKMELNDLKRWKRQVLIEWKRMLEENE